MLACKRRRISGCHFDFRLNHAKWHPGIASYALTCWTWINMLKGDTNNVLEISSDVSRSQEISDVLTGHGYKMFPIPILEIFSIPSGDQIPVPETISHFTHSEPSSGVSGVRVGIRFIFWAQKVFGIHSCLTLCWQFKFDVVLRCNKLEILDHCPCGHVCSLPFAFQRQDNLPAVSDLRQSFIHEIRSRLLFYHMDHVPISVR